MARKKEKRAESISGGYAAIPWAVLDSESFKGATDKAKALLFALMRQHNGQNNGHLHLARKWLSSHGWKCDESNRKATKELIERGLIIQTKWGGLNVGANLYALTWYDISSYIGLDITPKGYRKGAYTLCNLPPTARQKPPTKKQSERLGYRACTGSATELASQVTGSATELVKPIFEHFTGSATEHNVITPLPVIKNTNQITDSSICTHSEINLLSEYEQKLAHFGFAGGSHHSRVVEHINTLTH